eukprot:CAMPEP_0115543228 /NCGR_PEP_ID=MMETSP0271-20121206/91439_1 /TAXON_ID=71861 /ORGANISM="Scrippsiella trochoidea, Strain CCMP3099" /LENGTH=52 /DNA_ID=CAMNT_0002976455 /DNA_START=77 /DNA_END=231 /DNA_ORIENTATION=+
MTNLNDNNSSFVFGSKHTSTSFALTLKSMLTCPMVVVSAEFGETEIETNTLL